MKPKYNIGDKVWVARFYRTSWQVPCDSCCGQKYLTVIMGDGTQVTIDCVMCAHGCNWPTGTQTEYGYKPDSVKTVINRVERDSHGKFRYGTEVSYSPEESDLSLTQEEADARAQEKFVEYNAEEKRRRELQKEKQNHTWAWNASYHRKEIKRAKHDIEYHTAQLDVASKHARIQKAKGTA